MKVQILSDLHIEKEANLHSFINRCIPRAETLIIAGDVHPHKTISSSGELIWDENRERFIVDNLLPKWKNVIIIPGNHEFYGSVHNDEWFGSQVKTYSNDNGHKVHYCNNHVLELNGYYFICGTLWSHISAQNDYPIRKVLHDYSEIQRLTPDMVNDYHDVNKKFFIDSVTFLPKGKRAVLITHHVPSFNLISPRWRGSCLNDAFSADMDVFIMKYRDKISHWIHGHSHDPINEVVEGIRFIRNPMGYPKELNPNMDFIIHI